MTARGVFERDLRLLQEDLLRLGGLVDTAIRLVIEALQARSVEQAEAVIASIERLSDMGSRTHAKTPRGEPEAPKPIPPTAITPSRPTRPFRGGPD